MDAATSPSAGLEWRTHWRTPLAGAAALAVSVTHLYSLGVFLPSLTSEFGWSRSQITSCLALVSVIQVTLASGVGALVDRVGPKHVGLAGLAAYALAVAGLALAGPSLASWWIAWVFVAVATAFIQPTVFVAALTWQFKASLGVAMSMMLMGIGLASVVLPPIANEAIEALSWRGAYVAMAAMGAALALPAVWLLFPARRDAGSAQQSSVELAPDGRAAQQAFLSLRFARLALASLLMTGASVALVIHFFPLLTDSGLSHHTAAAIAGLSGIGMIAGRLSMGALLDRFGGPGATMLLFAGVPVAIGILLLLPVSVPSASFASLLIGFATGGEGTCIAYMVARYFGLRNFGVLFGTLIGLMNVGGGMGPFLAGMAYDHFHEYRQVLLVFATLFIFGGLVVATAGRYPLAQDRA